MSITVSPLGNKTVDFQRCILISPTLKNRTLSPTIINTIRDLRSLVKKLVIYEDMTSPVLTAELELQDDVNLSTIVPLLGIETIAIKFEVPNIDNPAATRSYEFQFRVYKQSNREPMGHAAETYTLGLVSPELIGSLEKRISKTYKNVKMEDIIRDILRSDKYLNSTKNAFFEPTVTPVNITIPYLSLLDTIKLFTLQGANSDNQSSYFFYETLNGFRFESLNGIIRRSKTVTNPPTISRRLRGLVSGRDSKENISLEEITMLNGFDILDHLQNGYFASSTIGVDVLSGKYQITSTDLETNNFNNKPRLNANPFYPKEFSRIANPTSKIFLVPTQRISAGSDSPIPMAHRPSDNFFERTLASRVREITELQTVTVRVKSPGAPDINVGNVVYINIPYGSDPNRVEVLPQDLRSGRYLIVSAKHSLINNGHGQFFYETVFEACTDSYA